MAIPQRLIVGTYLFVVAVAIMPAMLTVLALGNLMAVGVMLAILTKATLVGLLSSMVAGYVNIKDNYENKTSHYDNYQSIEAECKKSASQYSFLTMVGKRLQQGLLMITTEGDLTVFGLPVALSPMNVTQLGNQVKKGWLNSFPGAKRSREQQFERSQAKLCADVKAGVADVVQDAQEAASGCLSAINSLFNPARRNVAERRAEAAARSATRGSHRK